MKRSDYLIALLERIAFQTQGGNLEIHEYLARTVVAEYKRRHPDAPITTGKVQGKDDKERKKDTPGIRQRDKSGDRGQKPSLWSYAHRK